MHAAAPLPDDIDALKALIAQQRDQLQAIGQERDAISEERDRLRGDKDEDLQKIEHLKLLVAKLQRMLFGKKSEKLAAQLDQLQLQLEELYINQASRAQQAQSEVASAPRTPATRKPLPEHLPRQVVEHPVAEACCPDCGGAWRKLGEDASEMLEFVPSSFRVIRHVRPRMACCGCDRIAQASAPSRPIARGMAGPGLLAHVFVSKYADHMPLYRQSAIYAREGVELADSTLGDWVGSGHALLAPLLEALRLHVFGATKLHADDTPIAVMAPGTGKTRQARLWVYARDERACAATAAPAVWFRYSPDRKGEHPQNHLKTFCGTLQADAFAGYNALYQSGRIRHAACWAHARRKFHDIHVDRPTPITTGALTRIAELYRIEAQIRGSPTAHRLEQRQALARPIVHEMHGWLTAQLATASRKSTTAEAIQYALNQWSALGLYLDDGELEIDNLIAERALRGVAIGRKNYLFVGSDRGGERAATMYSLLETAKLNGVNPEAYLRHVLSVIADHPVNDVASLLPWNVCC